MTALVEDRRLTRETAATEPSTPAPRMSPAPLIRLVYVAGYGRSGSTLLERLIGSHPEISALGEIAYLTDDLEAGFYWDRVGDSPYWNAVRNTLPFTNDALPAIHRRQLREEGVATGWRSWIFGPSAAYRDVWASVLQTLAAHAPPQTRFLVDSSKTARERFFRPFLLAQVPGVDVRVLHVVRDGRGCLHSVLKGSNKAMEQHDDAPAGSSWKACLGWMTANLSASLWRITRNRSNHLEVRYERFLDNPAAALDDVGRFLGVDFSAQKQWLRDGAPIPTTDQFAGNRNRRATHVVLQRDDEWKSKLPLRNRIQFFALCWPVLLLQALLRRIGKDSR